MRWRIYLETQKKKIAETILGRQLLNNEVVHHMDEKPKNNKVENLIISRKDHGKLHRHLDKQ